MSGKTREEEMDDLLYSSSSISQSKTVRQTSLNGLARATVALKEISVIDWFLPSTVYLTPTSTAYRSPLMMNEERLPSREGEQKRFESKYSHYFHPIYGFNYAHIQKVLLWVRLLIDSDDKVSDCKVRISVFSGWNHSFHPYPYHSDSR